jgi:hypothetical protein
MSAYYAQWDTEDLDSWQGKDYPGHDEEEDDDEYESITIQKGECCNGCSRCLL